MHQFPESIPAISRREQTIERDRETEREAQRKIKAFASRLLKWSSNVHFRTSRNCASISQVPEMKSYFHVEMH
jgi:hypothetical protein